MQPADLDFAVLSKELIEQAKTIRFKAFGFSMYPVIQNNDVVSIEPVNFKDLRVSDIVLYLVSGEKPAIHRIVRKGPDWVTIRGDANTGLSETVPGKDIYGRLCCVERNGKVYQYTKHKRKLQDILKSKKRIFVRKIRAFLAMALRLLQAAFIYKAVARKIFRFPLVYKWQFDTGKGHCLFAMSGKKIAGRLYLNEPDSGNRDYDGYWIHGMWVAWYMRRLNIASTMLAMVIRHLVAKKAKRVGLFVFEDNTAANKLYRNYGFKRIIIDSIEAELEQEAKASGRRRIMLDREIAFKNNTISSIGCENLPLDKRDYIVRKAKSELLRERTKEIFREFNKKNIPFMPLKGIYLAEYIYKDPARRQMTDIDILIKKQDLNRANCVLISLGYEAPACFNDFVDVNRVFSINSLMYTLKETKQPLIHLHWHLINSTWPLDSFVATMDMQRFWGKAQAFDFDGISIHSFCDEHLLLYLAMHNFNHFFKKDMLLQDIAGLIQDKSRQFDWGFFIRECRRCRLPFIVYCSLFEVSRRCSIAISGLRQLAPQSKSSLERIALYCIQLKRFRYAGCIFAYWLQEKGLKAKLVFILKIFCPPRIVMAHSSNRRLADISIFDYLKRVLRG